MPFYSRPKFPDSDGENFQRFFTDSQVWSATVASTGETSLGNIRIPSGEIWVIEKIWAQGTGGEYRLDVGSFQDATCDYNDDPTITHDDDGGDIVAGMSVSGTGIPTDATVSSVTDNTEFELSASTTGGSVTNGTLTFTDDEALSNLNGKFVQNADGDAVKNKLIKPREGRGKALGEVIIPLARRAFPNLYKGKESSKKTGQEIESLLKNLWKTKDAVDPNILDFAKGITASAGKK